MKNTAVFTEQSSSIHAFILAKIYSNYVFSATGNEIVSAKDNNEDYNNEQMSTNCQETPQISLCKSKKHAIEIPMCIF